MSRLLLIFRREYLSYLRTPGFWISLLIGPLVGGFGLAAPRILQQATPTPHLAVIDFGSAQAGAAVAKALQAPNTAVRLIAAPPEAAGASTPEAAERALQPFLAGRALTPSGLGLDAAAVLTGPPEHVTIDFWSRNLSDPVLESLVASAVGDAMQAARLRSAGLDPRLIQAVESSRPEVRTFSPKAASGRVSLRDRLPSILGLGLAFLLFFSIFTGAGVLLNSVIEEKSTRVLEVLLSSASVPEILGGKILGAAALSATVIAAWAALAAVALQHRQPGLPAEVAAALFAHGLVFWFALFFLGGYLMYASVFAAIGSFCETVREAQTLLGPMMILVTIPIMFLTLAVDHPDAPLIAVLSWIPPFTPFLMTARLAAGPPLWQVLGALALMGLTVAGVLWLCTRAFRAGALSSGRFDLARLLSRRSAV